VADVAGLEAFSEAARGDFALGAESAGDVVVVADYGEVDRRRRTATIGVGVPFGYEPGYEGIEV
jgi:hypothetical protein